MTNKSKNLRSERAQARRQRRQMQQWSLFAVAAVIIAIILFNAVRNNTGGGGDPLNLSDAEVITTASGLQYQDDVVGTGPEAQPGYLVTVNYTGWLEDGTQFDSSLDPGGQPFTFQLGTGGVIPGWDEGVAGMKVGGVRILTIPGYLGYGAQGSPPIIPANATLIFKVELLEIQ